MKRYVEIKRQKESRVFIRYHRKKKKGIIKKYYTLIKTKGMAEFYSKDIQILRQSQSKIALDYLTKEGVSVTVMELQRVTSVFVECCLLPVDGELKEKVKKLDDWIKSKKNGSNKS